MAIGLLRESSSVCNTVGVGATTHSIVHIKGWRNGVYRLFLILVLNFWVLVLNFVILVLNDLDDSWQQLIPMFKLQIQLITDMDKQTKHAHGAATVVAQGGSLFSLCTLLFIHLLFFVMF